MKRFRVPDAICAYYLYCIKATVHNLELISERAHQNNFLLEAERHEKYFFRVCIQNFSPNFKGRIACATDAVEIKVSIAHVNSYFYLRGRRKSSLFKNRTGDS